METLMPTPMSRNPLAHHREIIGSRTPQLRGYKISLLAFWSRALRYPQYLEHGRTIAHRAWCTPAEELGAEDRKTLAWSEPAIYPSGDLEQVIELPRASVYNVQNNNTKYFSECWWNGMT